MNITELKELIRSGENERLEFKKSTGQRTDAARTVCAMLNGVGGFVLIGISDRGEIIGQHVSANTLNNIAHELRRIEPPAIFDMKTIVLPNGKSVIVLNISAGGGPYVYDGHPYARHGSTTQRQAGLPTPEFESYAGEVLIRFRTGKGALKTRQVGAGAESQPESLAMRIIYLLRDQGFLNLKYLHFLDKRWYPGAFA